ncbi:DNA polymerase III subunit delta [Pediococcus argentinicus]|uniref:DNA polymerase III subunit delta n=1 Tax=Pediococcus argentinicus TaxID=480391 RepID=A0A0R2NL92_9LACO|nr:DNA polymerase III subunit delta [Pediococcus argentinicus]KRO25602.1 DNA polymerase III, delta subunit [Pediococcus argentinicus]NKZ22128.1 DNA polymerase III subunit delta [Pediococcus argentinicus]GEP19578.1 DNA polymerase III subunit delta [Pediococcus argentinicus]
MKINELSKNIDNQRIDPVYLVQGNDQYLQEKVEKALLSIIPDDQRIMNVGILDFEQTTMSNILNEVESAPFFGERRLVIVRNAKFLTGERLKQKVDLDGLVNYLNHPEPTTVMVILAPYAKLDGRKKIVKDLKTKATLINTDSPSENEVRGYVNSDIEHNGYQIDNNGMNLLISRTDANLATIMNELPKLYLYGVDSKMITEQAVSELVPQSLNQNVFDLINALLNSNIKKALDIYADLMVLQEQPLRINAALLSQFRLLIQSKILSERGFSQGKVAEELKVHPYRVKLALQTSRRFNLERLEAGYLGLVDIEHQLKSTTRDPQGLFELFLVKFNNKKKI